MLWFLYHLNTATLLSLNLTHAFYSFRALNILQDILGIFWKVVIDVNGMQHLKRYFGKNYTIPYGNCKVKTASKRHTLCTCNSTLQHLQQNGNYILLSYTVVFCKHAIALESMRNIFCGITYGPLGVVGKHQVLYK